MSYGVEALSGAENRSYSKNKIGVFMSRTTGVKTHAHEIGHQLEDQLPGAQRRARQFRHWRKKKSGPRDVKMHEQFPGDGYKTWEVGNEDDFGRLWGRDSSSSFYNGKVYPRGSTETISMGLEAMYEDPIRFAEQDPEYFGFIMGILDGTIK